MLNVQCSMSLLCYELWIMGNSVYQKICSRFNCEWNSPRIHSHLSMSLCFSFRFLCFFSFSISVWFNSDLITYLWRFMCLLLLTVRLLIIIFFFFFFFFMDSVSAIHLTWFSLPIHTPKWVYRKFHSSGTSILLYIEIKHPRRIQDSSKNKTTL